MEHEDTSAKPEVKIIKAPSASLEDKNLVRAIINRIGGYRRYRLNEPVCLEFVSDSHCSMVGFSKRELAELAGESYTALVHPDDIQTFKRFIQDLSREEGCESISYRLITRDGTVVNVVDTMASIRRDEGLMRGYSVVCRASSDQGEGQREPDGKFAVMRVSGGTRPRIEKMSGFAEDLLSVEDRTRTLLLADFVSQADRESVRCALRRAQRDGYSKIGPCTIVTALGEGIECNLWVERIGETDQLAGCSFIIKIEKIPGRQEGQDEETLAFGKSLFSCLEENVFVADRLENTIALVCQNDEAPTGLPLNIRMNADDFLDWLLDLVSPKDRHLVRRFVTDAKSSEHGQGGDNPNPSKLKFETSAKSGLAPFGILTLVPVSSVKCFLCLGTAPSPAPLPVAKTDTKRIVARLFGSFSISVDGNPVFIKHDKGRELLALLIERRGELLTSRDAISILWEREPDDVLRGRYRKAAFRLMEDLEKNGIGHIVENDHGARRIAPELIECDYYDYLDGRAEPSGDFLPEYSWSEFVRIG